MLLNYLKNIIEVSALSSFFYFFSVWLKKDKEKNLLGYFYGYFLLFLISWYGSLAIINSFLLYTSPFIFLSFIMIHQEILQRNFISLKKEASINRDYDYLEELVRSALSAMNSNKNFYFVIEQQYDIKPFITTDFFLKADINQECIRYLIDSGSFNENKFLWCSSKGQLVAINAQWKFHSSYPQSTPVSPNQWKEDALLITTKTDVCVVKGNYTTRLFDLVLQGKLYEKLSSHQLLHLLKMQIIPSPRLGDKAYESSQRTALQEQNS